MIIVKGEPLGNRVSFTPKSSVLEIHAVMMVLKAYHLPQDMQAIELITKKDYHTFEQWLIMVLAGLTVIGLVISIPLYIWGKQIKFTARFTPKNGSPFTVEGDKDEWKMLQRFFA